MPPGCCWRVESKCDAGHGLTIVQLAPQEHAHLQAPRRSVPCSCSCSCSLAPTSAEDPDILALSQSLKALGVGVAADCLNFACSCSCACSRSQGRGCSHLRVRRSPALPLCARSLTHARPCSYTFESPFYHLLIGFLRVKDRSKLMPYKSCVAPPSPPSAVANVTRDAGT